MQIGAQRNATHCQSQNLPETRAMRTGVPRPYPRAKAHTSVSRCCRWSAKASWVWASLARATPLCWCCTSSGRAGNVSAMTGNRHPNMSTT